MPGAHRPRVAGARKCDIEDETPARERGFVVEMLNNPRKRESAATQRAAQEEQGGKDGSESDLITVSTGGRAHTGIMRSSM